MLSKLLKLPVAKRGSWFHETLGVISFSQADLDDIKRNFERNARGYEPYVRYGHHERGPGVFQGERALAYCVQMEQESEVLWGYFKPVTAEVLEEIEQEHYRYSSAEFLKNARDRETNEPLGRLLLGVALTNAPSVPWLPRNLVVQADNLAISLSDDLEPLAFPIELDTLAMMKAPEDPQASTQSESDETSEPEQLAEMAEPEQLAEMPAPEVDEQPNMLVRTLNQLAQFMQRIENVLSKQGEPAQMSDEPMKQPEAEAPEAAQPEAEAPEMEQPEAPEVEQLEAPEAQPEAPEPEAEKAEEADEDKAEEAELQAKLMAAEAALKAAQEALEAKAAEAQKLEQAYKEREFALMLSDRVKAVVSQGVPPAAAEKASQLIQALHHQAETLMLSDKQVSLVDAVFELLADHPGKVSFEQAGTVEVTEPLSVNPWLKRTEGLKAQAAAK